MEILSQEIVKVPDWLPWWVWLLCFVPVVVGFIYGIFNDFNKPTEWDKLFDKGQGCCWCIADDLQNKTYIRTDDSEYTFIEAKYCPKCGKKLCE